jgi:hypothetical protein
MKKNKLWIIAFLFLIVSIVIPFSQAISLGVSPASFTFENTLRGGFATYEGLLSTGDAGSLRVSYDVVGENSDWIQVDLGDALLSKDKPLSFDVTVRPPEDAANGEYSAKIRFFLATGFTGQEVESRIFTGLSVDVYFSVTGEEHVDCVIGGVSVSDAEEDRPLELYLTVKNNGNVRVKPKIDIAILDQSKETLMYTESFYADEVLPTTKKQILKEVDYDLIKSQYWMQVSSEDCSGSDFLTFNIVGFGEVYDLGEIVRMETPDVPVKGELVPVQAFFKNTGARVVNAKLRAIVSLDGNVVAVLESDELQVKPDEVVDLEAYFRPELQGNYVIKSQVLYNNKLTYEKSNNLVVSEHLEEESEGQGIQEITGGVVGAGSSSWLAVVVLFSIIILLFVLIMRKKKR